MAAAEFEALVAEGVHVGVDDGHDLLPVVPECRR
jgi:hypothetical protein